MTFENAIDFHVFILYPPNLVNSLIKSSRIFVNFGGIFYISNYVIFKDRV